MLKLRGSWTVVDPAMARKARKRLLRTVKPAQAVAAASVFRDVPEHELYGWIDMKLMAETKPFTLTAGVEHLIAEEIRHCYREGLLGASILGGYNLAISAYSQNPEGSIEFIDFVTQPEAQKIMMTKASLPPVLTETYDDPEVQKAAPFAEDLRTAVEQGEPRPVSPVYTQISEAIYTNVHEVLSGDADVDSAVSAMEDDIQKALETF